MVKTHHLHKAEIILSKFSTQTKEEVKAMVQAKDKVVVVATKIKAIKISSQIIHREQTHVDKDSLEVEGEVAEISREIMQRMIIENVRVVEEHVTLSVTVHQEIGVAEGSKIIMHLLVEVMMIMKGCLLCNMS